MKRPIVLIVDDVPEVTAGLTRALRAEPYEIVCRHAGEEALKFLARTPADVIVSDEKMPGMRGTELLSIVRERHPDTLRIMLTGHAETETLIRSINEGEIYRFLRKPCDRAELIVTIRQALEQRRLKLLSRKVVRMLDEKAEALRELEASSPGITSVERDSTGSIVLGDAYRDLDALANELRDELGDFVVEPEGTD